jgi:hypothetical protein
MSFRPGQAHIAGSGDVVSTRAGPHCRLAEGRLTLQKVFSGSGDVISTRAGPHHRIRRCRFDQGRATLPARGRSPDAAEPHGRIRRCRPAPPGDVMRTHCDHGCPGGGARRGGALPPAGERPLTVALAIGAANRACDVVRRQAEAEDGGDGPRRDSRRRARGRGVSATLAMGEPRARGRGARATLAMREPRARGRGARATLAMGEPRASHLVRATACRRAARRASARASGTRRWCGRATGTGA